MKSYEIDMCHGPIFPKLVRFLIPLILSGILQLLFHTADMIVVGRFTGSGALAAVGATTFLINIQVNLFIGLSTGANVVAARFIGARSERDVSETIHTAVAMSVVCGLAMTLICNIICRGALTWMNTPADVFEAAVLYIRIYFAGMPFLMLYNFGAAIMRAMGDTKHPLYFLTISGVVNCLLNVFFVVVMHMGVAGVATATVISQAISSILVVRSLYLAGKLQLGKLKIHGDKLAQILRIGLPAGFQSVLFNVANILVQSSVNTFGSIVMAGNTAANNIEHFLYVVISSTSQGVISFTSQNMGAKNAARAKKSYAEGLLFGGITVTLLGICSVLMGRLLLMPYTTDEEVIAAGMIRLGVVAGTYGLNAVNDTLAAGLRGLGYQMIPTSLILIGICLTRILWVTKVFPMFGTTRVLYMAYPVSWIVSILFLATAYFTYIRKKL